MGWATHSSNNAFSLVIQYYDVILQYRDDHHLWFGALYGMFDALNGHFGDDVEWGMVAYPPIIIRRNIASTGQSVQAQKKLYSDLMNNY